MKKIFLALAAVAALASCVKENAPVLDQDNDNLVTITALATKTTLDGTSVVWDADDAIKVVLDYAEDELQDFTMSSRSGSTASFTGTFAKEVTADYAFAVYPNSAVVVDGEGTRIKHTLPADQSAGITSGMNLSFADLDVEALAAGNATTLFENALALVKVIIPEGVKSVSLTSNRDALVGDIVYQFNPSLGGIYITGSPSGETVSLTKAEGLPTDNSILVYPGNAGVLTLEMVGLDGTTYTKTTENEIHFTASKYRTINLTEVFKMDVNATEAVSPLGGELVIPVAAAEQYIYTVDIDGDPSWISVDTSPSVQTKDFGGTNIVFDVDANTTGYPRSAEVTITWGTDGEKTFTVTQESAYLDFVYVDPADPASGLIQWEETFDIFGDNSLNNKLTASPYTGVFTIDLSDDFSKGMYKVSNIFMTDTYYGEGLQMINNKGGVYYADYADSKLTIKMADALKSYNFIADVVLDYDPANKIFSAVPLAFDLTNGSNVAKDGGYIGGYTATVKAVDPGAGGGGESPLNGTWNQTVVGMSWPSPSATMTIAVSGTTVTLTDFVAAGTVAVGTLDGDTITIPKGTNIGTGSNTAGPLSSDVILTVVGNTISTEPFNIAGWINVSSYSANKQ